MSTLKPLAQERGGATNILQEPNLYETSAERDPGFALELDLPDETRRFINDPTGEHSRINRLLSLEFYRPTTANLVENLSPEAEVSGKEFNTTGELLNNWRVIPIDADRTVQNKDLDSNAQLINKDLFYTNRSDKKEESGKLKLGFIFRGLGNGLAFIGKFGIDMFDAYKKTAKELNVKPDTRTDEQKAKEAEKKQKAQTIQGNINRIQNEAQRAQAADQKELMQDEIRLGVAGMSQEMKSELLKQELVENNKNIIHALSDAMKIQREKQEKQQKQAEMQAVRAPSAGDRARSLDKVDGQSGVVGANASAG